MNYESVIGLEVHVELATETKAYCSCANVFGGEVNTHCCPNCMGMPGTLPTLNEKVVEYAVKAGHALNCTINKVTKQDRKNYYYPDTAKGYQITQADHPICENGYLDFIVDESGNTKRIGITRIHIEEDACKMLHDESFAGSLIDFNRSGVPLIEIVTEPDIRSSEDTKAFLETIRNVLIAIGVTDGKMQEGSIRCDVNVSVMEEGSDTFGVRCEMKNVNTFSGAQRAVDYEVSRQIRLIEAGETISQDTLRWDDAKNENRILRSKEDANDYRYFPDPDLGTIIVSDELLKQTKNSIPELPHHKILRFMKEYGLPLFDANLLVENPEKESFFVETAALGSIKRTNISNWILGDISRLLNEKNLLITDSKISHKELFDMITLIENGEISNAAGKIIIEEILFTDKTPAAVVIEKNLVQISDTSALDQIVRQVLADNPQAIEQYKNGKTNILGYLVGQCMKASKGQGNPTALNSILLELIDKE